MEKKRSSNFSTFETNLLIKLVEDKKHVLDPQKLNAASINMKHGAWREITANFNDHSQIKTYRDEKALKKKYSNLKCDAKNWPQLKAEALAKLGFNPEICTKLLPPKPEKPIVPVAESIKVETNEDVDFVTYYKEVEHRMKEELPAYELELTENAGDIDLKSHQTHTKLGAKESEEVVHNSIDEKKFKLSEKEAKLNMKILETEHQEQMKLLQLKHKMTMKKLELEQERCRLVLDFLDTEKKKLKHFRVARASESQEDSA